MSTKCIMKLCKNDSQSALRVSDSPYCGFHLAEFKEREVDIPKGDGVFPLRPLEDLVFVKRTAKDTKTEGGLFIPDTNNDNPKTSGEIMAVGPGKFSETLGKVIKPRVEVGQKVVFSRHANMSIDIEGLIPKDGEEYLVMHADELIAVITGESGASLAPEPEPKVRAVN